MNFLHIHFEIQFNIIHYVVTKYIQQIAHYTTKS